MTRVITYGTFDLLHVGHLNILERLRGLGDELIVAVSTDEFNLGKGKKCVISYNDRARLVAALSCVTAVIPEMSWDQKVSDIKKHKIDIFGMGSDWTGKFDELKEVCRVVYLPRTDGISTTYLRETIAQRGLTKKTVEIETKDQ